MNKNRNIVNAISSKYVPQWGNKKEYIAIHYLGVVGENHELAADGCGAHFYIYWDGTIYQRCDLDAIVWAVGTAGCYTQKHPKARNSNTISIELCCKCDGNSKSAEDKKWYFTEETQEACIWLVQKLMAELNIPAENVLRHYDIVNKTCPAPYVHNNKYKTSWTWDEFKKRISDVTEDVTEVSKTTDKLWLGWTKRESGAAGFRQTNGDSGNAYGKYQFDRRYALVPFMQFCVDHSVRYAAFTPYIEYGAGSSALKNNASLTAIWKAYCDSYPEEFEMLQDVYAYQAYYLEAKKYIYNLYGILMDNHSPAVKGTLFSMAIRSGALCAAKNFNGCKDTTEDAVMLGTAYDTYGNQDANRWTKVGQWGDAMKALEENEYTEVLVDMTSADILPKTEEPWYRIRRTWEDAKTQKGAYHDLEKAKKCADSNAGYYVFDENGTIIYPEKKEGYVPGSASAWAIATAEDNDHGYNNAKGKRGGNPDFACSSFVNEAFRQAGIDLPESGTVYTAKMKSIYTKAGFEVVTDEVNLKTGEGLEVDDVVLAPGKHVEIYVGNGMLAGARGNAGSGKPENGATGDQSGYEIAVSPYWNYPWTVVLRYVGIKKENSVTVPTKHRVQVGAYSKKKNANLQIAKLKNKGFDAILKQDGGNYVVQAGLFEDKELAKELAAQIRAKGFEAIVKEV